MGVEGGSCSARSLGDQSSHPEAPLSPEAVGSSTALREQEILLARPRGDTHHFHPYFTAQSSVKWMQLTSKDGGKCSLVMCPGKRGPGLGSVLLVSSMLQLHFLHFVSRYFTLLVSSSHTDHFISVSAHPMSSLEHFDIPWLKDYRSTNNS